MLRLGVYFSLVLLGLHLGLLLGLLLGLHLGSVLLLLQLLLLVHLLLARLLLRLGVHFSLVLLGLHLGLHLGLLLGHVLLGLHICLRMLQLRSLLCLLALALQRGGPGLHLPRVLRQALGIARFTYAIGGVGWGHYWGQHRRIACSIASTAMFSRHCRIHRHRHLHRGLTPVIYGHRCSDGGCRYCCIDRVLPGSMHGTGGKCCACSGGCQGSASVRAAMIRASDGQLSLSLRLTAGVMPWARRAFVHIGHMHVFGAADVVDDGVRARHIGLVVVDHGRACLHGWQGVTSSPVGAGFAPVNIPGVPAPGVRVHGVGQQDTGSKAQQASYHRCGGAHDGRGRRGCDVLVAVIGGHGLAIDGLRVVAGNIDRVGLCGLNLYQLCRRCDQGVSDGCRHGAAGRVARGAGLCAHIHFELLGGFQRAGLVGPAAHDLHGIHHV